MLSAEEDRPALDIHSRHWAFPGVPPLLSDSILGAFLALVSVEMSLLEMTQCVLCFGLNTG